MMYNSGVLGSKVYIKEALFKKKRRVFYEQRFVYFPSRISFVKDVYDSE